MEMVLSINNVPIRLTDERWLHIVENHDDLAGYYFEILDTVANPQRVYEGSEGESIAIKKYQEDRFFVVIYREVSKDNGFIITAFLSSRIRQLERRRLIWQKSQ